MTLLKNKVAIVTGASSGIGAAIAKKFAEEGAKVAMVGRNETKLANVAQEIEKSGSKPLVILADVTKTDDCKRIVNETLKGFGKVDILVNNVGIGSGGGGGILDENVMVITDKLMSTNFMSAVLMSHLVAPHLIETKGNIINVSSVAGQAIFPGVSFAYSSSKAALDNFTKAIALELSVKGIRVNTVSPGPIRTDFFENTQAYNKANIDDIWEISRKKTALGRLGEVEEIADLAAFLASDKARSVTGCIYVSDNGILLKPGS